MVVAAMAEQPGDAIGRQDPGANHDDRQDARLHRHRQPLDDVGGVPGGRGLGDAAHRAVGGRGVVFGDPHQQPGDRQPDQGAVEDRGAGKAAGAERYAAAQADRDLDDDGDQHGGDHAAGGQALVERAHDVVGRAEPDEEGPGDAADDADAADHQRQQHHQLLCRAGEEDRGQHHGGDDGHGIGLEQVGGHAGAVADIVADIVGDHRRIARVVLGNAGLDLADQVGADVGPLGEDAAAETGEDRDQRGAEAEGDQRLEDGPDVEAGVAENDVVGGDAEQPQADDELPGDGARLEGDGQRRLHAVAGGLGGAQVRPDRDVHADIARSPRQDGADDVADRDIEAEGHAEDDADDDADHGDGGVLPVEVGARPLLDGRGDLAHARGAGVGSQDHPSRIGSIKQRQHATGQDQPISRLHR
jgi:hypothetical protein